MKRLTAVLLVVVMCCVATVSLAAGNKSNAFEFKKGNELVLFDKDDVRLTLTGEVDETSGMDICLLARFENNTGETLNIVTEGEKINGQKSLAAVMVIGSNTEAGKTSDCSIEINGMMADVGLYTDLRQMQLTFKVQKIDVVSSSSSSASSSSSSGGSGFSSSSSSASSSSSIVSPKGVYKKFGPITITFADYAENSGPRYFSEQPKLPHPMSFIGVKQTGSSSASSNGKVTSASYTFEFKDKGKKAEKAMKTYLDEMQNLGLTVVESNGEYVVSADGIPVAKISQDKNSFTVSIIP